MYVFIRQTWEKQRPQKDIYRTKTMCGMEIEESKTSKESERDGFDQRMACALLSRVPFGASPTSTIVLHRTC